MKNLSKTDRWKLKTAHMIADYFGHGWANYLHHASGASTLEEVLERVDKAMQIDEESGYGCRYRRMGLRPSLEHQSSSKRFRWEVKDQYAEINVCRPLGVTISIRRWRSGDVTIHHAVSPTREPRHTEAGLWAARALKCESEYRESIPPREFHSWIRKQKLDGCAL